MPYSIHINGDPSILNESGKTYHYEENRILENKLTGDYEVIYSGQNQGKLDFQLIEGINYGDDFTIFYRKKNNTPFRLLGTTTISKIIQHRTIGLNINSDSSERLQCHFLIPKNNIVNIPIPKTDFRGSGRYKKDALSYIDFNTDNINVCVGFYQLFF